MKNPTDTFPNAHLEKFFSILESKLASTNPLRFIPREILSRRILWKTELTFAIFENCSDMDVAELPNDIPMLVRRQWDEFSVHWIHSIRDSANEGKGARKRQPI